MASSWEPPSSPRPTLKVMVGGASLPHTADTSLKNYHWFKSQFDRVIVGYLSNKNGEQLVRRARSVLIEFLRNPKYKVQGVTCWKVIDELMNSLVKGSPVRPSIISYNRYVVQRESLETLVNTVSVSQFIRYMYRIIPMDQNLNNDYEYEALLWREGLGPQPSKDNMDAAHRRALLGFSSAPQDSNKNSKVLNGSHASRRFLNPFEAPLVASSAAFHRPHDEDVKPNLDVLLKRPGESSRDSAAKRRCTSGRDTNRQPPASQEAERVLPSSKDTSSHAKNNPSDCSAELSANFTKLLEDQQKQNAKQSIRIAQLEETLRVRDKALEHYDGLKAHEKRLQQTIQDRDEKIVKKADEVGQKAKECAEVNQKVVALYEELKVWKTTSRDDLRKAAKTAQLQRKLLDEHKPEIVSRTGNVLDHLEAYICFLETGKEDTHVGQENNETQVEQGTQAAQRPRNQGIINQAQVYQGNKHARADQGTKAIQLYQGNRDAQVDQGTKAVQVYQADKSAQGNQDSNEPKVNNSLQGLEEVEVAPDA